MKNVSVVSNLVTEGRENIFCFSQCCYEWLLFLFGYIYIQSSCHLATQKGADI